MSDQDKSTPAESASEKLESEGSGAGEKEGSKGKGGKSRRRWKIAGFSFLGVLVVLALVVFVLPTPLARYIIESQLEELGIQHDGVDSVKIDLWNSEVAAGPIRFRSGEADDGQIGGAGFRYSFENLFEKRAFIEEFFLRGIELVVKRHEDGSMTLNGIDLAQFAAEEAAAEAEKPEPEAEEGSGFGLGIGSFTFEDSTLVFEDLTGGAVAMELQHLTITDFRSWEPEVPSRLTMESRVNDISVKWEGTATPFADTLEVQLQTTMREGTIDKIARFTGPTGLSRQEGFFESDVAYNFTLFGDGRLEGTIKGEFRFLDIDIATEDGASVAVDKAVLDLDLVKEVVPEGATTLGGGLTLGVDALSVQGPAGEVIALNDVAFQLEELNFTQLAEQRSSAILDALEQEVGSDAAAAKTVVELLLVQAEAFALQALRHEMEIDGSPAISAASGLFSLPGTEGGPAQEIRFTNFSAGAPGVDSQTIPNGWTVTAAFEASLEQAWAGAAGQEQSSGVTATGGSLTAGSIAVETTTESGTSITFDVASGLEQVELKDPAGMALSLAKVSAGTPGMTVEGQGGEGHIRGPVELGLESIDSRLPSEDGDLTLSSQAIRFASEDFDIAGGESLSLALSAGLDFAQLALGKEGAQPLALALEAGRIDLSALKIDPLGPGAAVDARLVTKLSNLELALGADDKGQQLTLKEAEIGLEGLQVATAEGVRLALAAGSALRSNDLQLETAEGQRVSLPEAELGLDRLEMTAGEALNLDLAGAAELRGTQVTLPMTNGDELTAKVAQVKLGELQTALAGEALQIATEIAVRDIAVRTDAELPQVIDVAGVTVTGLKIDPAEAIEISAVAVDQLQAEITDAIAALGGAPAPEEAATEEEGAEGEKTEDATEEEAQEEEVAEEAAPAKSTTPEAAPQATSGPAFRLGEATISSGSVIKVTDTSVEPPMKIEIAIETAKVGPLDTGAPETKTDIDLGTAINQEAGLKVLGWASPLLASPDFDLQTDVSKFPLPPFSPYVSSAVGLNIDSGNLDAVVNAKAQGGALDGQIDVLVDELFLEPVSEEIDKEFESNYGISANFATGILKDDEGKIDLGFPVSGSLEEPQIDYSEVISKAIGGAMASLFPLNWFGDDGSSFEILPATFDPGTAVLTEQGEEAGDEIGKILVGKPQLPVRVCGKATAGDLIVLRGGVPPEPLPTTEEEIEEAEAEAEEEGEATLETEGESGEATAAEATAGEETAGEETAGEGTEAAAAPPLAKPDQQEIDQLLELALQRGQVMRDYLTQAHGINAERMSECRTSYSIDDGKAPRAEFRF